MQSPRQTIYCYTTDEADERCKDDARLLCEGIWGSKHHYPDAHSLSRQEKEAFLFLHEMRLLKRTLRYMYSVALEEFISS